MFSSSRLVTLLSRMELDCRDQLKAVFTDPLAKLCSTQPSTKLQQPGTGALSLSRERAAQ